jgi:pimeloyl-ACP methyl ester carboxylesterase
MTRTYARRDGKYVLEELVIETETKTDRATIRGKQHMQFRNVKWKENKDKDAERKDKLEKAPRTPSLAPPSAPSLNWGCDRGAIYDESGNPCFPDGGGGDTGGGGGGYTDPCGPVAGGQNIVLQHGINSDSTMWFKRMKDWLRCDWQLNTELVPTFPSYSSHSDQSYGLMGRMDGTGQSGFVLIGHSQGGLVSRYTAQRFTAQGRGHLIEGVVTIGTPHQGAVLARNLKQGPLNFMYGLAGASGRCGVQFLDASCHIKNFITQRLIDAFLTGIMNATVPATQDLQPGSQSLNHLNSQQEGFARYGIQHYAKKRWMPARLAGDLYRNPEDTWGGRNTVRYTEWAYQGLRVCNYASVFFGQFWLTSTCGHAHRGMDALDRGWDQISAPGMQSDGIVHGPSQVYPNGMEQFPIHNGDSHVGEGKSNHTKDRLDFLLRNRFGVKER